jgi:steroid delta-isomerase-like uncharacterized protein
MRDRIDQGSRRERLSIAMERDRHKRLVWLLRGGALVAGALLALRPVAGGDGPGGRHGRSMSSSANKAVVRRMVEALDMRDWAALDELIAPDFVYHVAGGEDIGVEEMKQTVAWGLAAFPDLQTTVEDMIEEDDKVVVRWTTHATHQGEFLGVPPTGQHVTCTGMSIYRIANGTIAEVWANADTLGVLQQLGLVPPLGQAAP